MKRNFQQTSQRDDVCQIIIIVIIIIIIIIIIQKERLQNAVYKITKDGCHYVWRAQTALIRYARRPAEWLNLRNIMMSRAESILETRSVVSERKVS